MFYLHPLFFTASCFIIIYDFSYLLENCNLILFFLPNYCHLFSTEKFVFTFSFIKTFLFNSLRIILLSIECLLWQIKRYNTAIFNLNFILVILYMIQFSSLVYILRVFLQLCDYGYGVLSYIFRLDISTFCTFPRSYNLFILLPWKP